MEKIADLDLSGLFQIYLQKLNSPILSPLFLTDDKPTQPEGYKEQLILSLAGFVVSGDYASFLSELNDMLCLKGKRPQSAIF